jgi:hypothetical protein
MPVLCGHCGKVLINNFSLRRHTQLMHDTNVSTSGEEPPADTDEETEEETPTESTETPDIDEEISDQSDDSDIDGGLRNPFWRYILGKAYEHIDILPDHFTDISEDIYYSKIIKHVREEFEEFEFLGKALESSDLNEKLEKTKEYYEDKMNFEEDEAQEMAWTTRTHMFKKLLLQNEDLFDSEIESRKLEDDEETVE